MIWNETPEGDDVVRAWDYLIDTYTNTVPRHVDSLRALARRPLAG